MCGEMLSEAFHADHIVPWSDSFDDSDTSVGRLGKPAWAL